MGFAHAQQGRATEHPAQMAQPADHGSCKALQEHPHAEHRRHLSLEGKDRAGRHSREPAGQHKAKPLQGWLGTGTPWTLAYLGLVGALLLAVYAGLQTLTRSPWGRVLRAIREDEGAAASLGKRAFLFRLQSFVIGSMLMGLGGAVYAHFVGYIAPEDFLPILTFQIWAMLIVGGSGTHRGAVPGAFVGWAFWAAAVALLRGFSPPSEPERAAAL